MMFLVSIRTFSWKCKKKMPSHHLGQIFTQTYCDIPSLKFIIDVMKCLEEYRNFAEVSSSSFSNCSRYLFRNFCKGLFRKFFRDTFRNAFKTSVRNIFRDYFGNFSTDSCRNSVMMSPEINPYDLFENFLQRLLQGFLQEFHYGFFQKF